MSLKYVIGFSTAFITIYCISILANYLPLALLLVSLSPALIIWMAYRILKDHFESKYTFQDRFYQDHEYQRQTDRE